MSDDGKVIKHYGILGMRWGRRRTNPYDEKARRLGKKANESFDDWWKNTKDAKSEQKKINRFTKDQNAFDKVDKKARDFEKMAQKIEKYERKPTLFRFGRKEGESNADYDKRVKTEMFGKIANTKVMNERVSEIRTNKAIVSTVATVLALGILMKEASR